MGDLAALAARHRIKPVRFEVDGEPYEINLHVPVGAQAVQFLRASRAVVAKLERLVHCNAACGFDGDDEEVVRTVVAQLLATPEGRAKLEAADQAKNALNEASVEFALAWLPRLSPELAKLGEEGLGNVLRLTGFNTSPLIVALQSMTRISQGTEGEDDGLEDLPFPDLHAD